MMQCILNDKVLIVKYFYDTIATTNKYLSKHILAASQRDRINPISMVILSFLQK
jgi:hypothetical protein